MNVIVCEASNAFGQEASNWCERTVQKIGARSLFVPAGQTPIALYEIWERDRPAFLEGRSLYQVDDVLTGERQGMFRDFFVQHLPSYLDQMRWVGAREDKADVAILGLGLNGHVAFHEPGIHESLYCGCVRLNDPTCDHLKLARGTWGITYGLAAFLSTKAALIMVNGASKRDVLRRLREGDASLPASRLLGHPNLTLIADREAWGGDAAAVARHT